MSGISAEIGPAAVVFRVRVPRSRMVMDELAALKDLVARHVPRDGMHPCALPGVMLARANAPTLPMPVIYQPTLCLIAQGRKRAVLGNTDFLYDPASFLVASVDLPVIGSVVGATPAEPISACSFRLIRKR